MHLLMVERLHNHRSKYFPYPFYIKNKYDVVIFILNNKLYFILPIIYVFSSLYRLYILLYILTIKPTFVYICSNFVYIYLFFFYNSRVPSLYIIYYINLFYFYLLNMWEPIYILPFEHNRRTIDIHFSFPQFYNLYMVRIYFLQSSYLTLLMRSQI